MELAFNLGDIFEGWQREVVGMGFVGNIVKGGQLSVLMVLVV
jgi:hypothetical protein